MVARTRSGVDLVVHATAGQGRGDSTGGCRTTCGDVQRAAIVGPTRTERDLLGDKQIPVDAYYGVQTATAVENFRISGVAINHYPGFVEA